MFRKPLIVQSETGEQKLKAAEHRRADNKRMRAIPQQDRLLTIVCNAGTRPAIFGVVVRHRDGHDHLMVGTANGIGRGYMTPPDGEEYLCRCGRAHPVTPSRVWELADRLRHSSPRRRQVDVSQVA